MAMAPNEVGWPGPPSSVRPHTTTGPKRPVQLRGDKDAAVQLFQSAIIYAPNDPAPYAQLGRYYATTGQNELAAQFFNSALSVQPAYAPAPPTEGGLLDGVNGYTVAKDGQIQHFTGLLIGKDGTVKKLLQPGDKRPEWLDFRLDGKSAREH